MFSCDLVNWVIKDIYSITMGLARLVELPWLVTFCRVPILSRYSSFCLSNEFDRSRISNDRVRDVNMRAIRGLFHKTIISVSKI